MGEMPPVNKSLQRAAVCQLVPHCDTPTLEDEVIRSGAKIKSRFFSLEEKKKIFEF